MVSGRKAGGFSEADDWDCWWWGSKADIEFDVDVVREDDDEKIGVVLISKEQVFLRKEDANVLFDKDSLDSPFRKSSTKYLINKLEEKFRFSR